MDPRLTVRSASASPLDGAELRSVNEETIRQLVHGFYDAVRNDLVIGPIFMRQIEPGRWPHTLTHMCDFWSSMLLNTRRYEGRPLRPHLAIEGLGEAHFRRWLTLFRTTVGELCPPDIAALFMDRALRVAHSFRLAIAFHCGEDSLSVQPIREESL